MSKTSKIRVLVILASVRPARRGEEVLRWWSSMAHRTVADAQVEIEMADLRDLDLSWGQEPEEPQTGRYALESTRRWAALVGGADAFVIMTPEYNHSMPASLKNALDLLGPQWAGKPVAWVSYGNTSAGTRALAAAKQVAAAVGLVSVGPDVSLRLAEVDEAGQPALPARGDLARAALTSVVQHAGALRQLHRDPVNVPELPGGYVAHRGEASDAGELLILQRACWVDEAVANQTLNIRALHEGLEKVENALSRHHSVMVRRSGRLIASIQAWPEGDVWWMGRLMVAADHRRHGLAKALFRHAAAGAPSTARRIRLNTGGASVVNLSFYESEGFVHEPSDRQGVATLSKPITPDRSNHAAASATREI